MQFMYYTEEFHNENAFHLYIAEEVQKISMRMTPNKWEKTNLNWWWLTILNVGAFKESILQIYITMRLLFNAGANVVVLL